MLGQQFSIIPITEIPYNPQGYDIVEQVHGTLKQYLHKLKRGELYPCTSNNYLNQALFILNF